MTSISEYAQKQLRKGKKGTGAMLTGEQIEELVKIRMDARRYWKMDNCKTWRDDQKLVDLGLGYRDEYFDFHPTEAADEWPDVVEYIRKGRLSKNPREYPTMRRRGAK